jgi:hypothetical protein
MVRPPGAFSQSTGGIIWQAECLRWWLWFSIQAATLARAAVLVPRCSTER